MSSSLNTGSEFQGDPAYIEFEVMSCDRTLGGMVSLNVRMWPSQKAAITELPWFELGKEVE